MIFFIIGFAAGVSVLFFLRNEKERNTLSQRLDLAVESAKIGIWDYDIPSNSAIWDRTMYALYGKDPSSLVESALETWQNALHPDDLEHASKSVADAIAGRSKLDISFRIRWPDGSIRHLRSIGELQKDKDGSPVRLVGVNLDITREKESESKLVELTQRFRIATDSAMIGIWDLDLISNTVVWDKNMYQLYGLGSVSLPGMTYENWKTLIHPDDLELVKNGFLSAVEKETKLDMIFRIVWPNATTRYIRTFSECISDSTGKVIRMVGVNWDITQEKEMELLKNEFISVVSHEIRTPLTSIYVSLQIIQDGKTFQISNDMKQLVSIASESCESLTRLVNDILDVEKIESGKMNFNLNRQSLLELLSHAVESNQPFAQKYPGISIQLAGTVPADAYLMVDLDRFQQIMNNLLSNAVKFSYANQIVRIEAYRFNDQIRIQIINQGDPIPDSFRPRIFQKFCQVDSSNTRQKGGTGLGLNITKAIVEKHGGQINFKSSNGETTFYFDLPEAV